MMRKVNVHFTLNDEAYSYCRMVNMAIREITPSAIFFGNDSSMIPHITLVMGGLDEGNIDIAEFIAYVEKTASHISPVQFSPGQPYLEDVVHSYVFSDLDVSSYFLNLRQEVIEKSQSGLLSDIGGSYGLQPPHLTLANVSEHRDLVRQKLAELPPGPAFISNSIEVSDVGRKGTCINSLAVFSLKREKGENIG